MPGRMKLKKSAKTAELKKRSSKAIPVVCVILLAAGVCFSFRWWAPEVSRRTGGFFRPYLELANTGNAALSDKTLLLRDRASLAREIETLRRHNTDLESRGGLALALLEENRRLRRHLNLSPPREWDYVHAEVLLLDPYAWQNSFTIDRGSRHGVASGDAVIECRTPGIRNLVGIVGRVEPDRAQVLMPGNPAVRLSVRLGGTDTVGFLNVTDRSATMDEVPVGLLPQEYIFRKGQMVTTTGLERAVPAGLKVGEMASLESGGEFFAGDTQKSGFVRLAANYGSLRFLVVITAKKPHPAAAARRDRP